ncbi:MAG: hypothetical protein ACT4PV_00345 [Planctomycetaceae bacterium]
MRKVALLAFVLAVPCAGEDPPPSPRALVGELLRQLDMKAADLAVRDRELLRADERFRQHFPEEEAHLLRTVREALDRPLELPARAETLARAAHAAKDWKETQESLAAFLHSPPLPAAALDELGPDLSALPPELAESVALLYRHVAGFAAAASASGGHPPEQRARLAEILPRWVGRTTPEEMELAKRGEEDAAQREAMMQAAAILPGGRGRVVVPGAGQLVAAIEEILPALRKPSGFAGTLRVETRFGPVVVRGEGNDSGDADAFLLLDLGGDDEYRLPDTPTDRLVRLLIDCAGNDLYLSKAPYSWGASLLGVSIHIDCEGDDDYRGGDYSLGCGLGGFGLLWDASGKDRYYAGLGSQGAGLFGAGLLKDDGGDDEYVAGCFCQGFASSGGFGALLDRSGDDSFLAGRDEPDGWRRPATFITFAQGSAYSHRFGVVTRDEKGEQRFKITGQIPGGAGMLLDGGGDDRYEADVFAQGSAYWYSLGILVDSSGRDRYRATWYGQGVGTHAAAGCLLDLDGDDWYFSRTTSQGCGHDFSVGILWDRSGDDAYRGVGLCQGAGNALSGLGLLVDEAGDDDYRCGSNGWGYGSAVDRHPHAAPFGFFLDLGGGNRFTGGAVADAGPGKRWRQPPRGFGVDGGA